MVSPVLISIKIKGNKDKLLVAQIKRLGKAIPIRNKETSENILQDIKGEAQSIVRSNTSGFGTGQLQESFIITSGKGDKTTFATLGIVGPAKRYAGYVHEGFPSRRIKREDFSPSLSAWLKRAMGHVPNEVTINPPWAAGGMKFLEIPFKSRLGGMGQRFSRAIFEELQKTIAK